MLFASMLDEIVNSERSIDSRSIQYENQVYHLRDGPDFLGHDIEKKKLQEHLNGRGISSNSAETYDIFIRELFLKSFHPSSEPIGDPQEKISVFEFGEKIGIPIDQARFILDFKYAATFPSFSTFSETPRKASSFTKDHGGIYYLYRFDRNETLQSLGYPLGAVLRSDVIVRYPVPYKGLNLQGKDSYRIRCKMNLPQYEPASKGGLFKYDGYVSKKGSGWWQWLFQLRRIDHQNSEDLILMYTERKPNRALKSKTGVEMRRGVMLHQNQSTEMDPCANRIILSRLPEHNVRETEPPSRLISSILKKPGDRYFQMDRPERETVRSPKIFDLHQDRDLDEIDALSVKALMDEEYRQNVTLGRLL